MRLGLRDLIAALLMAVVIAPYAGLLARGRTLGDLDVRTMSTVALAAGLSALAVAGGLTLKTLVGRAELGFAAVAAALGVAAIVLAHTVFGPLLLGALVTGLLLTWAVQLLDHAGYPRTPTRPGGNSHEQLSHRRGSGRL